MTGRVHALASIAALCVTAVAPSVSAQTIETSALHLADATKIANEAVKLAADGPPVAVAVTNAEGNLVAALRMDGTSFINLEAAEQKARTAIVMASPTKQAEQALAHGDLTLLGIKGMLPMAGGVPILLDGNVVGGIGVSGREPVEDDALAVKAGQVFGKGPKTAR
ncbi:GlcG/HbpS family heme-binding protein [Sphingomonas bacterium]|uniref:GlcG/HbpS family heme-binding protein n=1 Tax=Sphingomonas bacterium TaxID=1895847 RepID=UPI001576545C|nr:heme-binding protein [Sphingomonas bacterium]